MTVQQPKCRKFTRENNALSTQYKIEWE